ncbi:MAG TPA: hypothetical protein VFS49_11445 [Croceibacterium sp.]|nr:hypothetical protein [Croceibacterium sp.]
MDRDSIEPLGLESWFASVRRLSVLAAGGQATVGSALRHAYHLVQLAPHGLRGSIAATLSERAFEQLLEAGVYDIAAQALVGSPAGLALVRQPGSRTIFAEVRFPAGSGVGCGQGRTIALAILQAWCRAALALDRSTDRAPARAQRHAKVVSFHACFRDETAPLGA